MMSLGVSLTIQSVSAQGLPDQTDNCQKHPLACKGILSVCDKHPEVCTRVTPIVVKKVLVIPPDPLCTRCPERAIVDLTPGELMVLGQLGNDTIAVKVSPQDILQMLSNATANVKSSLSNVTATIKSNLAK